MRAENFFCRRDPGKHLFYLGKHCQWHTNRQNAFPGVDPKHRVSHFLPCPKANPETQKPDVSTSVFTFPLASRGSQNQHVFLQLRPLKAWPPSRHSPPLPPSCCPRAMHRLLQSRFPAFQRGFGSKEMRILREQQEQQSV